MKKYCKRCGKELKKSDFIDIRECEDCFRQKIGESLKELQEIYNKKGF